MERIYFDEFIEKLKTLKDNQVLKTTFGPLSHFEAGRFTDDMPKVYYDFDKPPYEYYIRETSCGMYKSNTILPFTTSETLEYQLLHSEKFQRWYAENVFSGKLQHFDNYKGFLRAFN